MNLDDILTNDDLFAQFVAWQPAVEPMAVYCRAVDYGMEGDDILNLCGPDAPYAIDWATLGLARPVNVMGIFVEYGNELNVHADGIIRRTVNDIYWELKPLLEPYAESFEASLATSAPSAAGISLDDIDWSTLQSINQALLKDLDEGQDLPYWQAGSYLLIGADQSEAWRMALEAANGLQATGSSNTGYILMEEKGGFTGSGSITVSNSPDPDAFKATLREFSNKKINFV